MKKIYEPASGILTVQYVPNGEICCENPPKFSWLPATEENKDYILEISEDINFSKETTKSYKNIAHNFFTPPDILENGKYFWRYGLKLEGEPCFSIARSFEIDENSVKTPLPLSENRFNTASKEHPRLWLSKDSLAEFKKALKEDKAHCNFHKFYENCVKPRLEKDLIDEPKRYPNDVREVSLWRQNYTDCQEAYNHVRSLSIAGIILEDENIISNAKKALLSLASWDLNGSTSRDYNDECAFRVAEGLSWGYDWLYYNLSNDERALVFNSLYNRTQKIAEHAIVSSKIHYSLYDSHAIRSLSSVLTPACIALLWESDDAENWLNYTIDYLSVLYTPWGGSDGGWAEGGMYWTTGMAYLIGALNLLKNFCDIDIFQRPFFKETGNFPLYCFPHDTYRASFCDQSNLGEKPILKTGFNIREFAGITKNPQFQWYFEQTAKNESYDDKRFFNIGWWDFYIDELMYLSNHKGGIKSEPPKDGRIVKWFKDIGWVALHKDMNNNDEHIFMLTKSSFYGSVSHSHADQNAILLFAYGEPLLIESGYYIGFNSSMHKEWRRQTKSKNAILIDGVGQYAKMEKPLQLSAKGSVLEVSETEDYVYIKEDAAMAYKINVPEVNDCIREIYFVDNSYFVIVDSVSLSEEKPINFLLHSLVKPSVSENKIKFSGNKAKLSCEIVYSSSGVENIDISNNFDGVNEEEIKNLEKNWHMSLNTKPAKKHKLVTLLHPQKISQNATVETIKDDQGHDIYFYVTKEGKTFTLCIDGNERY